MLHSGPAAVHSTAELAQALDAVPGPLPKLTVDTVLTRRRVTSYWIPG